MKTAAAWRAGVATDRGRRSVNEDRVLVDDAHGVFLVVDGLGGHAAGEMAAETAARVIGEQIASNDLSTGEDIETRIRQAITAANNEIYELAQSNEKWQGMACVLTLAVAHEDRVIVGHVGDSRLYLVWNGNLRKLTSDHSPVGEQEDQGGLSEQEAMQHPRRNEVFRDVGSQPREPHDAQFIEIKSFIFRPDAALLLCSDGLSDVLTSAEISAIVERYDGDPDSTARQLVDAANAASGKDNISVVFVAGPEFLGSQSNTLLEIRSRHAVTRMRKGEARWHGVLRNALLLLTGMVLGILLWAALERLMPRQPAPQAKEVSVQHVPAHVTVKAEDALGIINALAAALPGDTLEVPPGQYLGPLRLKEHVNIVATVPGQAVVRSDPASSNDAGVALVARGIADVRVSGLAIAGDETHPLRTGILIADSSVVIEDADISAGIQAGVSIEGSSAGMLLANFIHANPGAGVVIKDRSSPRLAGNRISDNGKGTGPARAGIEIDQEARPVLENNFIMGNGVALLGAKSPEEEREIRRKNLIDTNGRRGFLPARRAAGSGT